MSRPPAVRGPFRGVFVLYVFENHPSKRRLNTSNPLKITPLQRGDPDVCHDPLLCMVRLEERLYYMFFENHSIKRRLNISNPLKITALQRGDPDVVDFRIKRPYVDFLCSKLNL